MKKTAYLVLCLTLLLALTACGSQTAPTESTPPVQTSAPADNPNDIQEPSAEPTGGGGVLIAYFSMPEGVDPTGVDAVSGASIVVDEGEILGNVQYMAKIIQEAVDGDAFRIETVQEYPLEHDALVDFASEEKDDKARPELTALPEGLEGYGTIFLGYPNWWADLPMPVYTFLESVDLSGKTIIPFCPHGGSGFSRTVSAIADLQPGAVVSENGLTISRGDVAKAEADITAWVQSLGF